MAESNNCRSIFYQCQDDCNRRLKELEDKREVLVSELDQRTDSFLKKIQILAKTGDLNAAGFAKKNIDINDDSDQENVPIKKGKPRKKTPLTESTKDNLQGVKIKKEKLSTETDAARSFVASTSSSLSEIPVDEIKSEQTDMPAPSWIPPKKKAKEIKTEKASVRTTRTKGKKAKVRDSDVVVQNATITTINLSDTEDSEGEKAPQLKENMTRSTRTKTRKIKGETDSGAETDTDSTRSTRTKTRNRKEEESIESNEMEPPRSTRTKTLRKGKKMEEESQRDQSEEPPEEIRRTKTIKKGAKLKDDLTDDNIDNNKKEETTTDSTKTTRATTEKDIEKNGEETSNIYKTNNVPKESVSKEVPKPTNQGKAKRQRSGSNSGEEAKNKKKSKSRSPVPDIEENANGTTRTVYEDACSVVGVPQDKNQPLLNSTYISASSSNQNAPVPPLNATVTLESATTSNAANCTMVLDKPQFTLFDKNSMEGMFTDDDSIEIKKTPPKKAATSKSNKEVFSPYEKTTLKKKVEAFEKLQNGSEIPVKTATSLRSHNTPSAVREKAKMFTPLASKFMPSSSSTSKITRFISSHQSSTSNESLTSMKVRSESAQKESRDRQRKHLEREQAFKKKEAMLQAQVEAKKKLNEEKQLKAQQQRKVLEAEKLKQLEAQKQKEAKLKQREREREEYLQKQKLELEKKRQEQKKKLAEKQAYRQQILDEQAKNPPIYMTTRLPKLPTEDCYDSDDPDYKKTVPPRWCQDEYSKRKQLAMLAAGEKIKNTLFCRHAQTPDLLEIFEVIDPKKLKRSSSVLWRKPPRYTMMPDLNDTKFEEDDELYDSD